MPKTRRQQHQTRRGTTRKGGKYVYSGAFGCAFRPAIKCRGEDSRREGKISKLMNVESAEEELSYGRLFKIIDPEKKYFIFPDAICEPDKSSSAEDDFASCRVLDITNPYIDARLLLSDDGGENLHNIKIDSADYFEFFKSLINVFNGLGLAHARGVVHMDVKPANIVSKKMEDGLFSTHLIDFGLSQETYDFNAPLETYPYYPFDIKFLHKDYYGPHVKRVPLESDAEMFYDEQKHNSHIFPNWCLIRKGGGRLNRAYAEAIIRLIRNGELKKTRCAFGCDVFGLGRSLAEIYSRLTGHMLVQQKRSYLGYIVARRGIVVSSKKLLGEDPATIEYNERLAKKVSAPLFSLIMEMVHINPARRITISEAAAKYARIIPAMERVFTDVPQLKRYLTISDPPSPPKAS